MADQFNTTPANRLHFTVTLFIPLHSLWCAEKGLRYRRFSIWRQSFRSKPSPLQYDSAIHQLSNFVSFSKSSRDQRPLGWLVYRLLTQDFNLLPISLRIALSRLFEAIFGLYQRQKLLCCP